MITVAVEQRKWWILVASSGVLGLTVLDETIVGVALPTIRSDLAMSEVASHWVVNAYLLTFTCFVALGGRLGDHVGRGRLFILGSAAFGIASLLCGTASDGGVLIAARALQGIGAAALFPSAIAMITLSFPADRQGAALGIQTSVAAMFMALGPLVGGLLTDMLSWRWIFWVNLPFVLIVAFCVWLAWEEPGTQGKPARPLQDWSGLAILVAGLIAAVIALMQGADWGWTALPTVTLFLAGIVLLTVFAVAEKKRQKPFFHIDLMRISTFTGGNVVFATFQFLKMVVFVFTPLYLQQVLKWSAIEAGAVLLFAVAPTLATSYAAGSLADRLGSRPLLVASLAVSGASLLVTALAVWTGTYWLLVAALVAWGAALPVIAVPARRALMNAVPAGERGQASGINLTIQMLGGTVGIALCGALLIETGAFWPVFALTGAVTLATIWIVLTMIERNGEQGS